METTTIHPAEVYLRNEQNSTSLYVRIAGQRRRLFINRNENVIGIIAPRKRKSGYIFTDWASIEKIYYPSSSPEDAADIGKKQVLKYQKLARLATHTNDWLRKIANADLDKSLYENRITTGTRIDGKCIGLATIEKMASMSSVPASLYESANLDGAGRLTQFFQITIPLVWTNIRTTLTFFIISTINMAFLFVKAMTSGGPNGASDVALNYMYSQKDAGLYGYSMAIGVVIFLFSFALEIRSNRLHCASFWLF